MINTTHTVSTFKLVGVLALLISLFSYCESIQTHAQETTKYVSELAWKSDGSILAVGYSDGSIELVNSATGIIEQTMVSEHAGAVVALAWHPTTSQLLSASVDRLLLWDLVTGSSYELAPTSWFSAATWNTDASRIIGFSATGQFTWDAQTLPPQPIPGDAGELPIHAIVWSPDRDQVATTVLGNVILRNPSTLERGPLIDNGGNGELAWSSDGQWLATSDWLNAIRIWNVSTGDFQQERLIQPAVYDAPTLDNPFRNIKALKFDASGEEILSVTGTGVFTRWDIATGQTLQVYQLPDASIREEEFSPDGTLLAYGGESGTLEIAPILLFPDDSEYGISNQTITDN
ncbi:MAG: PD40 domain-containing protein [Anaerolineae bacterium]|nr:PD40 domain-containing protein [Anaerolineae bacterium]